MKTLLLTIRPKKTDSLASQALSLVNNTGYKRAEVLQQTVTRCSAQNTSCLLPTGRIAAAGGKQVWDATRQKHDLYALTLSRPHCLLLEGNTQADETSSCSGHKSSCSYSGPG